MLNKQVLWLLIDLGNLVYIDDVFIYAETPEQVFEIFS